MRKLMTCAALALLTTAGTMASTASADVVLFQDTFDGRTTGSGDPNGEPAGTGNGFSDWGTSSDGNIAYTAGPGRTGGRNQVVGNGEGYLFTGGASADLGSLLSSSPDGFTVGFDFDRIVGSPTGRQNGYLVFGMGLNNGTAASAATATNASFGVLFQQENDTAMTQANAALRIGGETPINKEYEFDGTQTDFLNEAEYIPHSVLITITPEVAGAFGEGDLLNYNVDLDSNMGFFAGQFTMNANDLNTFGFSANNGAFAASVDNLVFSSVTAIPEPSSLALLSVVGLVGVARRRRAITC